MKHAADRTLQAAEELERRGTVFYDSFAAVCGNSRITALAASLANAKRKHLSVFRQMREALPPDRQLTDEELSGIAREIGAPVIPDASTVRMAVLASDLCTALDIAIAMETRMAACFEELSDRLGGPYSSIVASLVQEEKEHIGALTEQRRRILLKAG